MRISSVSKTDVRHICCLALDIVSNPLLTPLHLHNLVRASLKTGKTRKAVRFRQISWVVQKGGNRGCARPHKAISGLMAAIKNIKLEGGHQRKPEHSPLLPSHHHHHPPPQEKLSNSFTTRTRTREKFKATKIAVLQYITSPEKKGGLERKDRDSSDRERQFLRTTTSI